MFGVLFGGATALFPIFAGEIFSNGPMGLGNNPSSAFVARRTLSGGFLATILLVSAKLRDS